MRARRTAAMTSALLATLAVAGCEKPTPPVTFYSSGTAVDLRASSWCFEPGDRETCRDDGVAVPRLPVRTGQVAVNVTGEIAERGWYVSSEGSQQAPVFEEYTVFRGLGQIPEEGATIDLVVTDGPEGDGSETGRYRVELVPR